MKTVSAGFSLSFGKEIALPIFVWVLFTPCLTQWDLATSAFFYNEGTFSSARVWQWVYHYAIWPSWMATAAALFALFVSFNKKYASLRLPALYLLLTFAIGSGLIVHALLKEQWGRPRPKQIVEFGGSQSFHPYWKPSTDPIQEPSKSFPSGHASTGFYFFSLIFLGRAYRSKPIFWTGVVLSSSLGLLLSLARIAQGGHFLSDTLASALIMWITAWALAYCFFRS